MKLTDRLRQSINNHDIICHEAYFKVSDAAQAADLCFQSNDSRENKKNRFDSARHKDGHHLISITLQKCHEQQDQP